MIKLDQNGKTICIWSVQRHMCSRTGQATKRLTRQKDDTPYGSLVLWLWTHAQDITLRTSLLQFHRGNKTKWPITLPLLIFIFQWNVPLRFINGCAAVSSPNTHSQSMGVTFQEFHRVIFIPKDRWGDNTVPEKQGINSSVTHWPSTHLNPWHAGEPVRYDISN